MTNALAQRLIQGMHAHCLCSPSMAEVFTCLSNHYLKWSASLPSLLPVYCHQCTARHWKRSRHEVALNSLFGVQDVGHVVLLLSLLQPVASGAGADVAAAAIVGRPFVPTTDSMQ
mmetsp:Transcript_4668/g.9266  ORF Transcript_4668/g.9266 Transcript_4668/m.9266 type:complete len:115 (-) Transcript_4668:62-406(-)